MFDLFKKDDNNKVSELDSILKKLKVDTLYFNKIPSKYKIDKSVIFTLLKKEDFVYKNLSLEDRNNRILYQKIVVSKRDGSILKYAGDNVKNDFSSILLSVYFNPLSIDYVTSISGVSELEIEELLFWLIRKDERLLNFINNNILDEINITRDRLQNLNLDIIKIQEKYDKKLGINNKIDKKDKNKEKFTLGALFKK